MGDTKLKTENELKANGFNFHFNTALYYLTVLQSTNKNMLQIEVV